MLDAQVALKGPLFEINEIPLVEVNNLYSNICAPHIEE